MKKRIRLTETYLHNVIMESVVKILNEDMEGNLPPGTSGIDENGFYLVSNPMEYVKGNGLDIGIMYKVGKIKARPSIEGQANQGTVLDGGFVEREAYTENANSMIVRNPKGEEYQVPIDEFNRKYTPVDGAVPDADGYMLYNAFDKREISSPVKHNVCVDMSEFWGPGQKQYGRAGDAHFVNPRQAGSYLIGDSELRSTHVDNV